MDMIKVTFAYGALLILLGLIGFFATGAVSVTALIPAFFGVLVLGLAAVGKNANRRAMAMHVMAALALLAFFGTLAGVFKTVSLIGGGEVARPSAAISQAIMSLLSLAYLVPSVMSFITARRERTGRVEERQVP
jgi:hypothetical protein